MIKGGPKIINDRLILCLDAHDAKSYAGEPVTNLASGSWFTWVNSGAWTQNTYTTHESCPVGFPPGLKGVSGVQVLEGICTTTGSIHFGTGNVNPASASTQYTYSVWFYQKDRAGIGGPYARANVSNSNLGTMKYNGTTGSSNWPVNKWIKLEITFTTQSSDTQTYISNYFGSQVGDTMYFCAPQSEQKSYYSPYASGFRSAITSFLIHGNVGSGTTFEDSSPNKITVSNQNSVSHGGTSNFGGSAIQFSSSSSQQLTSASTDVINFGTGDWTIEFWFNMTSGSTARMHALSCGLGSTNNIDFNFNDGNAFWLYWNSGGTPNIIFGNDGDYGDGNWHHLMATRASGMVRVWVDGVHKGSNNYSSSTSMGQTASIYVGGKSGVYWDGFLDEIRIIKGTALWSGSGNFAVPTERFKNGAWLDRSGNENNGNFINEVNTGTSHYRDGQVIMPVANSYLNFDGSNDYIDLGTISSGNSLYISQGSIELWFKYSASQNGAIIGWGDTSNWGQLAVSNNWTGGMTNESIIIGSHKSSTDYWQFGVTDGADYYGDGNWHHIVFTKGIDNATNISCYIDGAQKTMVVQKAGTGKFFLDNVSSSQFNIGRRPYSGNDYYNGQVASVRIYSDILTQAEALQNYNATKGRFS